MSDKLLTPRQVTLCKQLCSSQQADSARAAAILAIHTGETQSSAASLSGLTIGQVRYILGRFRRMGMDALSFDKSHVTSDAPSTEVKKEKSKKTPKEKNKKVSKSKSKKDKKAQKNKKTKNAKNLDDKKKKQKKEKGKKGKKAKS